MFVNSEVKIFMWGVLMNPEWQLLPARSHMSAVFAQSSVTSSCWEPWGYRRLRTTARNTSLANTSLMWQLHPAAKNNYTCAHAHMRTCAHAHMRTCAHAHMRTCAHAHMRTCAHAHMHTCTHAHMHTCTHAHMHTCTHAHMHTCTHAHMHTCTHAHMHTCTHAHMQGQHTFKQYTHWLTRWPAHKNSITSKH